MSKPQHAILRFAKYKGPAISQIEAHNERTKVQYASNPDIDTSRSALNYHLITPAQKYRLEANEQISASGCRTRKDSVRLVEALIIGSPPKPNIHRKSFHAAFSGLKLLSPSILALSALNSTKPMHTTKRV